MGFSKLGSIALIASALASMTMTVSSTSTTSEIDSTGIYCDNANSVTFENYYHVIESTYHVPLSDNAIDFSVSGVDPINIALLPSGVDPTSVQQDYTGGYDIFIGNAGEPYAHISSTFGGTPDAIAALEDDQKISATAKDMSIVVSGSVVSLYKGHSRSDAKVLILTKDFGSDKGIGYGLFAYGFGDMECQECVAQSFQVMSGYVNAYADSVDLNQMTLTSTRSTQSTDDIGEGFETRSCGYSNDSSTIDLTNTPFKIAGLTSALANGQEVTIDTKAGTSNTNTEGHFFVSGWDASMTIQCPSEDLCNITCSGDCANCKVNNNDDRAKLKVAYKSAFTNATVFQDLSQRWNMCAAP